MTPVVSGREYRFGRYVMDSVNHRVLLDGVPVGLPWRCFDALSLLIDAQGAVVDRDMLFRKLWPGIEVEETSLTKVLSQLRRILAEGDPSTEYIETVPRIGYRLSVPVLENSAAPIVIAPPAVSTATSRRRWLWVSAAVAALVLIIITGAWGRNHYQRLDAAKRASAEGQRLWRLRGDPVALSGAIENFRRATQLDPENASYFAELATALTKVPYAGRPEWSAARDAAERGLQLDRNCAGCRATLGFVLFSVFWEWDSAGIHLREALRLAPNSAGLHGYMAMYLSSQAKLEEALKHADESIRLDSYFATGHYIRSLVLFFMRRHAESVAAADRSLAINSQNSGAWDARAFALLLSGREEEALKAWTQVQWPERERELIAAYRARGMRGALGILLDITADGKARETNVYRRARWRMHLGDRAGALDELELALHTQQFNLMYVAADPMFEGLQPEPRFQRTLTQMRLTGGAPL